MALLTTIKTFSFSLSQLHIIFARKVQTIAEIMTTKVPIRNQEYRKTSISVCLRPHSAIRETGKHSHFHIYQINVCSVIMTADDNDAMASGSPGTLSYQLYSYNIKFCHSALLQFFAVSFGFPLTGLIVMAIKWFFDETIFVQVIP